MREFTPSTTKRGNVRSYVSCVPLRGWKKKKITNEIFKCSKQWHATNTREQTVSCSGKLHGWHADRPGIGTAVHGNVSYARVQHHTKWWFCLGVLFLYISHIDIGVLIVKFVNADNTCEINVVSMRHSTVESQVYHEIHIWDPVVTHFGVFETFVSWDVWFFCAFDMFKFKKFGRCLWDVYDICFEFLRFFCEMFARSDIGVQYQS